jgi:hypothetical protein
MALSGFWTRIKQLFRQPARQTRAPARPVRAPTPMQTQRMPVYSPQPVVPAPVTPPVGPLDSATIIERIYQAARLHVLLNIKYNGVPRLVEGYSFREKRTGRLFYGFCYKDGRINSFKIEKIESIELTNQTFIPRWAIEL